MPLNGRRPLGLPLAGFMGEYLSDDDGLLPERSDGAVFTLHDPADFGRTLGSIAPARLAATVVVGVVSPSTSAPACGGLGVASPTSAPRRGGRWILDAAESGRGARRDPRKPHALFGRSASWLAKRSGDAAREVCLAEWPPLFGRDDGLPKPDPKLSNRLLHAAGFFGDCRTDSSFNHSTGVDERILRKLSVLSANISRRPAELQRN
mmetsp:Transcript_70148/g.195153  ORF Transcript_70148/g.195153 Transcript_70148/m.195153 type:complete len:207 (-) Transcript_70148:1981-2601(-)